uniref:ARAD1D14014p n=1 Tax=Blastobotrys adeninivorans TaxID=409370 RepID=A0A060T9S0_BLAAD
MKAVAVKENDKSADGLFIDDIPTPELAPGQALVRVKAFGLNRMDISQRQGNYPPPPGAPSTMGVEYAGVIEKIHSSGHKEKDIFKVGDRVFGLAPGGAYAEYIAANTRTMMKLPDELDFVQGAGIPEVWFTATQLLRTVGKLQKGQSLLFHAGASSLGIAAIQLAQLLGASKIYATVGNDDKKKFLTEKLHLEGTEEGTILPINYHTDKFEEVVKKDNENGVDVIIDPVGQSYFVRDLNTLAKDGTLIVIGMMSGTVLEEKLDLKLVLGKRLRIIGSTLRSQTPDYQSEIRDYVEWSVVPAIISGKLNSFTQGVYKFDQVSDAHKELEANKTMGKIIVTID